MQALQRPVLGWGLAGPCRCPPFLRDAARAPCGELSSWLARRRAARRCSTAAAAGDAAAAATAPAATPAAAQPAPKAAKKKQRLDDYCLAQHPEYSKMAVQSWIAQGKVLVNERPVTKAGHPVPPGARVLIRAEVAKFVCRAGYKLEAALDRFGIDPTGKTALDSGLSTGGFTDCLLQRGAARVFGVDVGYGQVHEKIRTDPRVTVLERTNLRYMMPADIQDVQVDIATLDLSFISVMKVLPAVCGVLRPGAELVVLVKPQFEAGRDQVKAGGLVTDPAVHRQCIERVSAGVQAYGFEPKGVIESPLQGQKSGNTEFLAYFSHDASRAELLRRAPAAVAEDESDEGESTGGEQQLERTAWRLKAVE